jgi:asparagine synthase (glutamine-hydrolysing)
MCGIAGIVSKNSQLISEQKIRSAVQCLQHRGPDEEGIWINEEHTIVLGHRRLNIIDLSSSAAQPMHYKNRYTIIHNGELYNYIELKQQLQQKGYSFSSESDTEVIVAAYNAYGPDCLQRFDGMFAFVIWDQQEKMLFAARDRFGEKPFFFFYDEEQFAFASEIKTLWSLGVPKKVNPSMLYNFLTIGYTTNPTDPQETFYQQVYKLPAASFLTYALSDHQLVIEKYWQIYPDINENIKEEEAIEQFKQMFSESVRKRLRSDVAIGTSLSGGLDSSAVVAFCEQQTTNQYTHKCFTASFKGFEKDESVYATKVANHFHVTQYVVEFNDEDILSLMNEVMWHQEEPIASASPLAQYKVFQLAAQNGVKVLLDGQGADEVLAGYHKYYKWYWQELYRQKKLNSSKELEAAKNLSIHESFTWKNKVAALFPEFAASLLQSRKAKQAWQHQELNRDFAFANKRNLYYSTPTSFDLNGALYFNTFIQGLEELLRLADRNSMAHSTEVRLPFLSHELVNYLFTLPAHFKIHRGWTKWLLRKSVDGLLPDEITWRRDKTGFEPPQKKWMENKAVQEAIMNGKKKLIDNNILNPSVLKRKIEPHASHAAQALDWKCWSASFLF